MKRIQVIINKPTIKPKEIEEAHKHSFTHRQEIEMSDLCGCFCCLNLFAPKVITDWIDDNESGRGQTALCPKCGIDSVIGEKSGFPITKEFLGKMKKYWF